LSALSKEHPRSAFLMNRNVQPDHPNGVRADRVFLTAEWQHLAMLNYEVDPLLLASFIPEGTALDRWNGKVFISPVGFQFLQTKLFGFLQIPMHSNFDEVNLRFYVRRQSVGHAYNEVRRGVAFIREVVQRRAIAFVARTFYKENYVALPMAHEIRPIGDNGLSVTYRWQSGKRWNEINLKTQGNSELPGAGSVEQFITEHYWGYAAQPDGGSMEYRVTHPSWRVWQIQQSAFQGDAQELYGEEIAAVLRGKPHSAFLAEGSAVTVMRGRRL
jgi:uncharacterized protein YqjF (DUF2071 family)